jgi:hypothetical protein
MFRTQLLHKSNGGIPGRCFFGLVGGEGRGGSGKSYTLASMAKLSMVGDCHITENIAFIKVLIRITIALDTFFLL